MVKVCIGLLVFLTAGTGLAFDPATAQRDILVPVVRIIDSPVNLQADLYPIYYRNHSAAEDLRWVQTRSAGMLLFVQQTADSALRTLSRLSGLSWEETRLDLYLLRYFPTPGSSNPLILPLGGTRAGALVEAAPAGFSQQYTLLFLLARRLLDQTNDQMSSPARGHAMWEQRADRRDLLAHLLAYEAGRLLFPADSVEAVLSSPYWQHHIAAYPILMESFIGRWRLSPERPLITWLTDKSTAMPVAEPAAADLTTEHSFPNTGSTALSSRSQLGLSVRTNGGRMVIEGLDKNKAAYQSGLRVGDIIESVGGIRPENHRELIERILARLDSPGATVRITRKGRQETVVLRPANQKN